MTPQLRKASSRSRCSSVVKSNSVLVKVFGLGRKVISVPVAVLPSAQRPRRPDLGERRLGDAVVEAHEPFRAVAEDAQVEARRTAR